MADRQKFPSGRQDQYMVRFADGLRERIKAAAEANGRSMNAEIVRTLEICFPETWKSERVMLGQIDPRGEIKGALFVGVGAEKLRALADRAGEPEAAGDIRAVRSDIARLERHLTRLEESLGVTGEMRKNLLSIEVLRRFVQELSKAENEE